MPSPDGTKGVLAPGLLDIQRTLRITCWPGPMTARILIYRATNIRWLCTARPDCGTSSEQHEVATEATRGKVKRGETRQGDSPIGPPGPTVSLIPGCKRIMYAAINRNEHGRAFFRRTIFRRICREFTTHDTLRRHELRQCSVKTVYDRRRLLARLACVAGRITRTKDRSDFRIIVESIEQKTVHGDWDAAVCLFDRNIHEGLEKFLVENCRGFSSVSDKSPAIFLIL